MTSFIDNPGRIIVDDPMSPAQAMTEEDMAELFAWWQQTYKIICGPCGVPCHAKDCNCNGKRLETDG